MNTISVIGVKYLALSAVSIYLFQMIYKDDEERERFKFFKKPVILKCGKKRN